jgi:hypothetical protein
MDQSRLAQGGAADEHLHRVGVMHPPHRIDIVHPALLRPAQLLQAVQLGDGELLRHAPGHAVRQFLGKAGVHQRHFHAVLLDILHTATQRQHSQPDDNQPNTAHRAQLPVFSEQAP